LGGFGGEVRMILEWPDLKIEGEVRGYKICINKVNIIEFVFVMM
jgi:hypothetical protein